MIPDNAIVTFAVLPCSSADYFRAAWLTYICYYYYSYDLETAIPLRATPCAAGSFIPFRRRCDYYDLSGAVHSKMQEPR